jgi:hypothetical protein
MQIDDDVLLHILAFLRVPDVISARQTCKRMTLLSQFRSVWQTVCQDQVVTKCLPFVDTTTRPLSTMRQAELEARARRAYRLSQTWLSSRQSNTFFRPHKITSTRDTHVFDIRFLPGHDATRFMTVSKDIWYQICIWELDEQTSEVRKLLTWGPRGVIICSLVLNDDSNSEGTIAVSTLQNDAQCIVILSLMPEGDSYVLKEVASINAASHKPMLVHGDLLVTSDDFSTVLVWNWRTGEHATLQHPADDNGPFLHHDQCVQVVFSHNSVLVVRERTVHLFPMPNLQSTSSPIDPLVSHPFTWIDSIHVQVSVSPQSDPGSYPSISILCREEGENPWSTGTHYIHLYSIDPNPSYDASDPQSIPYSFPPRLVARTVSKKGYSRCSQVILGARGTAVWIHPQDRSSTGLVSPDLFAHVTELQRTVSTAGPAHETLMISAFPGPLFNEKSAAVSKTGSGDCVAVEGRPLWTNGLNDWSAIDYDESNGRIAIGTSQGKIMIMNI